jgi:DGQHR domain-containing protein
MKIDLIEVNQPIGTFYMACLPAQIVADSCDIAKRQYDSANLLTKGGVQRVLSPRRVAEITAYTEDPDATFPTPIIIAVYPDAPCTLTGLSLDFNEKAKFGEIIDGQHRIEGLKKSKNIASFQLPVILMFDLVEEEKAYVFSIISSKQTPVSKSLIYDLFTLSETRSPQKTCHEIARLMNSDEMSPYFMRLKMLGRKEHKDAALSQGSFVKYLIKLISKNPDQDLIDLKLKKKLADDPSRPLRYYFINKEDNYIYKILLNLFTAVRFVFPEEWNKPTEYILSKTTGYGALMKALPTLLTEGNKKHDLSENFFKAKMQEFQGRLLTANQILKSSDFPSNEQEQGKLAQIITGSG